MRAEGPGHGYVGNRAEASERAVGRRRARAQVERRGTREPGRISDLDELAGVEASARDLYGRARLGRVGPYRRRLEPELPESTPIGRSNHVVLLVVERKTSDIGDGVDGARNSRPARAPVERLKNPRGVRADQHVHPVVRIEGDGLRLRAVRRKEGKLAVVRNKIGERLVDVPCRTTIGGELHLACGRVGHDEMIHAGRVDGDRRDPLEARCHEAD